MARFAADDWRSRAACRGTSVDMVPTGKDEQTGEFRLTDQVRIALRRAKQVCAGCPVVTRCLLDAERLTLQYGDEHVQGIRGGLSERERATMAGLGRLPEPCVSCGYDCVPVALSVAECESCDPTAKMNYDDYRLLIEQAVRAGKSYLEIAGQLRLRKVVVQVACRRWSLKIGKRSAARRRATLKQCGTVAAKRRHHRDKPFSWRDCPACQAVPWREPRPAAA